MKNDISDFELLKEISNKLSQLIDIIPLQGKEKDEQIKLLVNKGYSNGDISYLLGIPKGTIDSIRASFKKKRKR